MSVIVFNRRVAVHATTDTPWRPFVIAALLLTVLVGALTGAYDLWNLRVLAQGVPVDHHRAHGLVQSFGFVGLFTVGISLHLAPRFFGAPLPGRRFVRALQIAGITGVVLMALGRLPGLVPGARVLAVLGAAVLAAWLVTWASWVLGLFRSGQAPREPMHRFLGAGACWFALSALTLVAWQLGQTFGGPLSAVPLEAVYAPVIFGGAASWLLGVFLRAGMCTLRLTRPSGAAQQRLFVAWQGAVLTVVVARWCPLGSLDALASLALAAAVGFGAYVLRPWSGPDASDGTLRPRAVQLGLGFAAVFGALELWSALGAAAGVWTPPLLRDATRHAFTLGCVTLLICGFAGRMVPGFLGNALRWRRAYDAGVIALALSAAMRLAQLFSTRGALAAAGASGVLALLGLGLVAAALLVSLRTQHFPFAARAMGRAA